MPIGDFRIGPRQQSREDSRGAPLNSNFTPPGHNILFIISSLIYIGIVLVLGARPMYVHFTHKYLGGVDDLEIMGFYALVIALSFYVAIAPMRRGIRALKVRDF